MNFNLRMLVSVVLMMFYGVIRLFLGIEYTPSNEQITIYIFSIVLILSTMKEVSIEDHKISINIRKKEFYAVFIAIYLQTFFMIWGFNIDPSILKWVQASIFAICSIVYFK